MSKKFY